MKKNILCFLLGGLFFSSITAGAAYVYTARDIGYQPSDENWSVSNASEALSSLKEDLNTVNTNVTEYKQQITEALADKGVSVNENSSMAEIQSGITNMSNGPTLIGTYSGNQTIDVSSYIKSGDTADNFLIEFLGTDTQTSGTNGHSEDKYVRISILSMTPSKTLSGNTLTIGMQGTARLMRNSSDGAWGAGPTIKMNFAYNYKYKLYYIG